MYSKALLIVASPEHQRGDILRSFRGANAHNVFWLRGRLKEYGITTPPAVAKELVFVASWSTDLRYEPGPGDPSDAQRFMKSTSAVLQWADGRI